MWSLTPKKKLCEAIPESDYQHGHSFTFLDWQVILFGGILTYKIEEANISKRKKCDHGEKYTQQNSNSIDLSHRDGQRGSHVFKLVHTVEHGLNQPNFHIYFSCNITKNSMFMSVILNGKVFVEEK